MKWTKEMVEEVMKCANDPIYFAEHHYRIINPVKGAQLIALYDFQKQMVQNMHSNRFNIILSARQVGKCVGEDTKIQVYDSETDTHYETTISEFFDII
jgi:hypothetical protein